MARSKVSTDVVAALRDTLVTEVLSLVASDVSAARSYEVQRRLSAYQKLRLDLLNYVDVRKGKE